MMTEAEFDNMYASSPYFHSNKATARWWYEQGKSAAEKQAEQGQKQCRSCGEIFEIYDGLCAMCHKQQEHG